MKTGKETPSWHADAHHMNMNVKMHFRHSADAAVSPMSPT